MGSSQSSASEWTSSEGTKRTTHGAQRSCENCRRYKLQDVTSNKKNRQFAQQSVHSSLVDQRGPVPMPIRMLIPALRKGRRAHTHIHLASDWRPAFRRRIQWCPSVSPFRTASRGRWTTRRSERPGPLTFHEVQTTIFRTAHRWCHLLLLFSGSVV